MIKSLTVTNYLGKKLKITLAEAEPSHGLLVKSISGLGPADATLNYSDYATNDGSEFNSAKLDKRSIQITLQMANTDKCTVEQARHNTYIFFPTKKEVRLTFETDSRTLFCTGRIEHNTPSIFEENEYATIDVVCEDPYFYKDTIDGGKNRVDFMLVNPAFSSEYANPDDPTDESLATFYTELDTPNLTIGAYAATNNVTQNIINDGDTEVGFILKVHFAGGITGNICVENADHDLIRLYTDKIEELIGSSIASGDDIELSTDPKYRYAKFTRGDVSVNILNALDFEHLTWLQLYPGDNIMTYYVDSGTDNTEAEFVYKTVYLGV